MGAEGRLESEEQVGSKAPNGRRADELISQAGDELLALPDSAALPAHVQALIERLMDGTEPFERRYFEIQKFNPRHINMCVLRSAGFKLTEIAEITGFGYQNIGQTMMHPYAKKLIRELQKCSGAKVLDIRTRLTEYASDLLDRTFATAIEIKDPDKIDDLAKITFGLLDRAGYSPKDAAADRPPAVNDRLNQSETTFKRLANALERSEAVDREIMPNFTVSVPPDDSLGETPEQPQSDLHNALHEADDAQRGVA